MMNFNRRQRIISQPTRIKARPVTIDRRDIEHDDDSCSDTDSDLFRSHGENLQPRANYREEEKDLKIPFAMDRE